jgi:hypothetical protein
MTIAALTSAAQQIGFFAAFLGGSKDWRLIEKKSLALA